MCAGKNVRHLSATALLFLFAAGTTTAADINVIALTTGKAVVAINGGKPQTVAQGQVTPEGVKLVSASSESAIFEVAGKRHTLAMGQNISIGGGPVGAQRAMLTADGGGHFITTAAVNGVSIRFMVDTGASVVTLSSGDARRAGINYLAGQKALFQTANGTAVAYRVKLDTVRLGEITLNNVDGAVVEGNAMGEHGLLGLSFLNRLEMRREGFSMTLIRRY